MHLLAPYLLDFLAIAYALTWCLFSLWSWQVGKFAS